MRITEEEYKKLPDLSERELDRMGFIRQKVKQFCKGCENLRAMIPIYDGKGVYSLCCYVCGEVAAENVDAHKLFKNIEGV